MSLPVIVRVCVVMPIDQKTPKNKLQFREALCALQLSDDYFVESHLSWSTMQHLNRCQLHTTFVSSH